MKRRIFHPEYATPECDTVADLVVHDKAGERIVEDLLHQAEKRRREDGVRDVFRDAGAVRCRRHFCEDVRRGGGSGNLDAQQALLGAMCSGWRGLMALTGDTVE